MYISWMQDYIYFLDLKGYRLTRYHNELGAYGCAYLFYCGNYHMYYWLETENEGIQKWIRVINNIFPGNNIIRNLKK